MTHDTLHAALAAVQAALPTIGKAHTAKTKTFDYTYASLNDVNRALLPLLSANGLTWTCAMSVDPRALVGTLSHVGTGDHVVSWWPLPATSDPQQLGSAVTYARRYMLLAVTGSAPDEDDDGAAAMRAVDQVASSQEPRVESLKDVLAWLPDAFVDTQDMPALRDWVAADPPTREGVAVAKLHERHATWSAEEQS